MKHKPVLFHLALICAVALLTSEQLLGQDYNIPRLREAAQYIATGNLTGAESVLQGLLRESPDDYRALDLMGITRVQQHRESDAESLFLHSIRQVPTFASAHVHLGILYLQLGRNGDSVPQLQEGLRLDPTRTDASAALVNIWRSDAQLATSTGALEKALALLISARKLASENADVQFEFGMTSLRMSLFTDAVDGFQKTLTLRANDPLALYGLGRAFMGLSKFEEARQRFALYTDLRPDDASGHYALGMSLATLQRSVEAQAEFEKSIALAPVQTESYFRLGLLDLDAKDLDSAARNLHRVLDRDPKHAGALAALGRVELEKKNYAQAAAFLNHAVASDDSLREAHYYLGLTLARMGRKQESEEQLQIAARLDRDESQRQRTVFKLDPAKIDTQDPAK